MNYESQGRKASRTIRALLADRNDSIERLAEGSGISLSTLKRRLIGGAFTLDEIAQIADYFGISIVDVITPINERPAITVVAPDASALV
ncbi:MAG: helix-turn-helix transcriptional regulator [Proteobacteria bacterium]|nr:helix-turn-helix transcriptional regulator [Pseudomonadota bacterium]